MIGNYIFISEIMKDFIIDYHQIPLFNNSRSMMAKVIERRNAQRLEDQNLLRVEDKDHLHFLIPDALRFQRTRLLHGNQTKNL